MRRWYAELNYFSTREFWQPYYLLYSHHPISPQSPPPLVNKENAKWFLSATPLPSHVPQAFGRRSRREKKHIEIPHLRHHPRAVSPYQPSSDAMCRLNHVVLLLYSRTGAAAAADAAAVAITFRSAFVRSIPSTTFRFPVYANFRITHKFYLYRRMGVSVYIHILTNTSKYVVPNDGFAVGLGWIFPLGGNFLHPFRDARFREESIGAFSDIGGICTARMSWSGNTSRLHTQPNESGNYYSCSTKRSSPFQRGYETASVSFY